jgi:nitrite reductase/ring-hydroxylating ferredoxin subunit
VFTPASSDGGGAARGAGEGTCAKISVQCAYHGWSFDGASGAAVDVPRLTTSAAAPPPPSLCATVKRCRLTR